MNSRSGDLLSVRECNLHTGNSCFLVACLASSEHLLPPTNWPQHPIFTCRLRPPFLLGAAPNWYAARQFLRCHEIPMPRHRATKLSYQTNTGHEPQARGHVRCRVAKYPRLYFWCWEHAGCGVDQSARCKRGGPCSTTAYACRCLTDKIRSNIPIRVLRAALQMIAAVISRKEPIVDSQRPEA
jgi:hypothetical protein